MDINQTTMSLQEFYINELSWWLCKQESIGISHRSQSLDIVVIYKEGAPEKPIDFSILNQEKLPLNKMVEHKGYSLLFFKSLPSVLFDKTELEEDEINQYGWYHHQLLQQILLWTDQQFIPFLNCIINHSKDGMMPIEKNSDKALYILKTLIKQVETNNIIQGKPLIPDLFTFNQHTNLMSFREKLTQEWLGEKKDGYKYVYMFSLTTSHNFAEALLGLLRKKFSDNLFISSLDNEKSTNEIESKEGIYNLPKDLYARIAYIEGYYKLKESKRGARLKYNRGQMLYLFKILEESKIILDILPKEQLALAISILTGVSFHSVYQRYPHKEKLIREVLLEKKNPVTIKDQIDGISNDTIAAIAEGQKKYGFIS